MNDTNDSGSYQFRLVDAMSRLGLWMTLTTMGRDLSTLDTMNT